MTLRHLGHQPLTSRTAAATAGHIGFCPGFVEEHQMLDRQILHPLAPLLTTLANIGAILLRGPEHLFLKVSCKARRARDNVGMLMVIPSRCRSSSNVASGWT